ISALLPVDRNLPRIQVIQSPLSLHISSLGITSHLSVPPISHRIYASLSLSLISADSPPLSPRSGSKKRSRSVHTIERSSIILSKDNTINLLDTFIGTRPSKKDLLRKKILTQGIIS